MRIFFKNAIFGALAGLFYGLFSFGIYFSINYYDTIRVVQAKQDSISRIDVVMAFPVALSFFNAISNLPFHPIYAWLKLSGLSLFDFNSVSYPYYGKINIGEVITSILVLTVLGTFVGMLATFIAKLVNLMINKLNNRS